MVSFLSRQAGDGLSGWWASSYVNRLTKVANKSSNKPKGALSIIACFVLLPETYPPRLLELKAARLRKETGNSLLRSKYDKCQTPARLLRLSIIRPTKMLVCSPIVVIVSLFLAIAYSYMYLMFTTFTDVFETTYGFNAGEAGLTYLGLGIGSLVGQYALDLFMRRHIKKRLEIGRAHV